MIQHNFAKALKEGVVLASFNKFQGNNRHYPDFMYEDYTPAPPANTPEVSIIPPDLNIDAITVTYDFDISAFSEAYTELSDTYSRKLFLDLLIFRVFGPSKVKLPLTDYTLFEKIFLLQKATSHTVSAYNTNNRLHDLSAFGIPLSLFYDPYGIFITFFRRQYEYGNIKAKEGDYVIDGGACFGDTALYFAHAVGKSGKVFSFEFVPNNMKCFEENIQVNPSVKDIITLIPAPLWENSQSELFIIENEAASYCVDTEPEHYHSKVQSTSIDDFVKNNNIPKIDFIKFDIEGAEPQALLGATKTIQTFKPQLAICIYHDFKHFHEIPKIIKTILPEYNLYIDHHSIHLGETVLYASVECAQKSPEEHMEECADIVVIDSILPNKNACGSRNADALEFRKQLESFTYYSMFPMLPGSKAWFGHGYGISPREYDVALETYIKKYPEMRDSIKYLHPDKKYTCNLAFCYFVAETYTLLPFFKKHRIPFAFLLAPGGAFGFENESSDAMLKEIVDSGLCRKIFVFHKKIGDYLAKKNICSEDLIHFDPLGTLHFTPKDIREKKFYKKDKNTFDICFVAFKYTERGIDKGYDLFIDAAKILATMYDDIRFHVVGDFTAKDIDITPIQDKISFRTTILPRFLPAFYANMDIHLSPNRPFKIFKGSFDGFPLGSTAMYCGVCGFNTDPLGLNSEYIDREDIVLIEAQTDNIVNNIIHYYHNTEELYRIAACGQKKAIELLDTKKCIENRIAILQKIKNTSSMPTAHK